MKKEKIFIGGAWPYANNLMHIGHLVALLPGDILARYFRKAGNEVLYVSGSDCHGTPITIRAEILGVSPEKVSEHYDNEFRKNFEDLSFTYDLYTNTTTDFHAMSVQENLKKISENGYLYQKTEKEDFCPSCNKYRSDREIKGVCPICKNIADGDQCDKCLTALTPDMLNDKICKICGKPTVLKDNIHLYFKMSALTDEIYKYFNKYSHTWRQTAVNETSKYLKEGLRDRAITRSLSWGIEVPFEGFEDKRLYVWIEAVLGYISAGQKAAQLKGLDFENFIRDKNTTSFYVHGKDNIVFHTIILPALLHAIDPKMVKPQMIISSEYLNSGSDKMSKSKGNLIPVNTLLANFDSDSIRYYFIFNNPERKDTTFSLDDFIAIHNKHLVGGYGNFINRNLSFLQKKYNGVLPKLNLDKDVENTVKETYEKIGQLIEKGELKEAATRLYDYVQYANKYYDQNTPWVLAKNNPTEFDKITSNCLYLIVNMANLYEPILPKRADIVKKLLGVKNNGWAPVEYDASIILENISVLFNRISLKDIDMNKGTEDTFSKKE